MSGANGAVYGDEGRLVAGRYRLLARIGRGGMGTVWRAEDELLGRQVAVKKLHPPHPDMDEDELGTLFERTRREARAAARISHPNVVVVHDVVDDAGLPSIVMEYVPSVTLGEFLKEKGPLPPAEAARIGRGMVAALRAAHRAGVVHRDVKPGNVLLGKEEDDGGATRIVLTDFGIAQASGTSTLTRTGELIGSIDFLSPERIRGVPPGPESDLWALGATLYQAVEGVSPFRRPTAIETAYAIAEEPLPPASRAGVLTELITGLLARDPQERLSAEDAERMLRLPASEADTALVDRDRFDTPAPDRTATTRNVVPQSGYPPAGAQGGFGPPPIQPTALQGPQGPLSPPGPLGPQNGPYGPPGDPADTAAPLTLQGAQGLEQGPGRGQRRGGPVGPGGPGGTGSHAAAGPDTPAPRRRRRALPWIAVAAVLVLAGGGLLAAHQLGGKDDNTADGSNGKQTGTPSTAKSGPTATQPATQPATTPTSIGPPPPLPAGYKRAQESDDGHDYSVPVPQNWKRSMPNGQDEVDWTSADGLVGLKVSSLAFGSTDPLEHFEDLEPQTSSQVKSYHRLQMRRTLQDGDQAALWEFTFKGSVHVRDWHAIDLGFGKPGGTEYAIYLSAPASMWQQWLPAWNNAVAGFRAVGN